MTAAQLEIGGTSSAPDITRSQWFTDPNLARRIVAWALRGYEKPLRILEPSAGRGALCIPVPWPRSVVAYEIDPRWEDELWDTSSVAEVRVENYLSSPRPATRYDLAITNPPYERGQDGQFLGRALDDCDRVVALIRTAALQGKRRFELVWSRCRMTRLVLLDPRPRFVGPGEHDPRSEYCVVEIVPGSGDLSPVSVERW